MLSKEARARAGSKDTKGGFGSFFLKTRRMVKMPARINFLKAISQKSRGR